MFYSSSRVRSSRAAKSRKTWSCTQNFLCPTRCLYFGSTDHFLGGLDQDTRKKQKLKTTPTKIFSMRVLWETRREPRQKVQENLSMCHEVLNKNHVKVKTVQTKTQKLIWVGLRSEGVRYNTKGLDEDKKHKQKEAAQREGREREKVAKKFFTHLVRPTSFIEPPCS